MPTVFERFLNLENTRTQSRSQPKLMAGVNSILLKYPENVRERFNQGKQADGFVAQMLAMEYKAPPPVPPKQTGFFARVGNAFAGFAERLADRIENVFNRKPVLNVDNSKFRDNFSNKTKVAENITYFRAVKEISSYLHANHKTFVKDYLPVVPVLAKNKSFVENNLAKFKDVCDRNVKVILDLKHEAYKAACFSPNPDTRKHIEQIREIAKNIRDFGGNTETFSSQYKSELEKNLNLYFNDVINNKNMSFESLKEIIGFFNGVENDVKGLKVNHQPIEKAINMLNQKVEGMTSSTLDAVVSATIPQSQRNRDTADLRPKRGMS